MNDDDDNSIPPQPQPVIEIPDDIRDDLGSVPDVLVTPDDALSVDEPVPNLNRTIDSEGAVALTRCRRRRRLSDTDSFGNGQPVWERGDDGRLNRNRVHLAME